MKKLALGLGTAAAIALAAPLFSTASVAAPDRIQLAQADVKIKVGGGERRRVKKVVIKRGEGVRRGWRHSRHYGTTKKVVIKRKGDTVKKKVIINR